MILETSAIGDCASIGENVKIGNFTTIEDDVVVGSNTIIGNNVSLLNGTRIGSHCVVHSGAVLGGTPQDLKYRNEYTRLEIGDRNRIHEFVTINKGTKSKGVTRIGSDNLIMAGAHIGHDCVIGNHCVIGFSTGIAGEVTIGDYANISGLSGVHQFCRIGSHVMISGLSKVVKDVPPYIIAGRDPLSYAGINTIGLRRRGFEQAALDELKEIYNIIFRKNMNTTAALEYICSSLQPSPAREQIVEFIAQSRRGILKARN
ncbi:acyl-ACP--UDP-N-acetylglucosamine O-acyltransferase [Chryseolinea sp. T2]|uniref:acyl-ACP--UDP-N-acetylglucosamine O-acyltransferase n=1 Tax=Chryseolinea sp. T2 TaxID=3129255 RepID=UPI00307876A9